MKPRPMTKLEHVDAKRTGISALPTDLFYGLARSVVCCRARTAIDFDLRYSPPEAMPNF